MAQRAAFQLDKYFFNKVIINLDNKVNGKLSIDFGPSGVFSPDESSYYLKFSFKAFDDEKNENAFVEIECVGVFTFDNVHKLEEIPSFFYRNAIAILFPYLRAFVSMVTLQANIPPLVLPTFNLSDLERPLQENTSITEE